MTKKINTVDTSFFTERAKSANQTRVYHFDEEKEYSITYFPKFSKSKKDKLIMELFETIDYCTKNKVEYLQDEKSTEQYLGYLIIKYFTSLYDTLSTWSIEQQAEYCLELYDSGDYELFFEDIFSFEEIQKVNDQLKVASDRVASYIKKMNKNKNKPLVNNELKKMMN